MNPCSLQHSDAGEDLSRFSPERGFTLVEILVALALSSVIALAAIASLTVARTGFTAVDASSQLRDNGRFAAEMIKRVVVQAGYKDAEYAAATTAFANTTTTVAEPDISGVNNALVKSFANSLPPDLTTDFLTRPGANATDSNCSSNPDTACDNGSDALIIRYQTSPRIAGSTVSDGSMINCAGIADTTVPVNANDRMISVIHVAKSTTGSEPSLMCSYRSAAGVWTTQPIVEGVESLQVLYGVDGATSGANTTFPATLQDTVPDRYFNASQMVSGTDTVVANRITTATYGNWEKVRSLRIGLVLRGPANSAPVKVGNIATMCPLGYIDWTTSPINTPANCIDPPATGDNASTSPGSEFPRKGAAIADDGRLRQVLTFTVHLRNHQ